MTKLESAYLATCYRVFVPQGPFDLQVGQENPQFKEWLEMHSASHWALLTAHNPASQPLSASENIERQSLLEVALLEAGFEPYVGENCATDDWPAEESCLVLHISSEKAVAYGKRFAQNAILIGSADGIPQLQWIQEQT